MDEESDDVMAPMVDALTGAMSAILLVSIFMMINTMSDVAASAKEYGQQALYKNEQLLMHVFDLEPPILEVDKSRLFFFVSFNLTTPQAEELSTLFKENKPIKITLYSNDKDEVVTYNALLFFSQTGLVDMLDNIDINYLPARDENVTEIVWEFQ